MTTLVTGLSGFVGSHCAEQFQSSDLLLDGQPVDLRDGERVRAAVDAIRPEWVIHLAAQSFIPAAFANPMETQSVNFLGTLNLLLALRDTGFKGRLLFVGSGDVYGAVPEDALPLLETRLPKPRNPYAVSKVAAEALCYQWSQTEPFEIVLARPFNHVGPRQGAQFAVADFARQISEIRKGRRDAKLHVGDIDATRDFCDVRDIVRAYRQLLEHGVNGETYNVCSGVERSLRSIIETLAALAGTSVELVTDPARMRPSEQRRVVGSFDKLHHQTGWQPAISFEQTLRDILDYWDQRELP